MREEKTGRRSCRRVKLNKRFGIAGSAVAALLLMASPAIAAAAGPDPAGKLDSDISDTVSVYHGAVDAGRSMPAGMPTMPPNLSGADLDTVRGAGIEAAGPADFGGNTEVGVILWDEVKRNKLGQQGGVSASSVVDGVTGTITVRITTY